MPTSLMGMLSPRVVQATWESVMSNLDENDAMASVAHAGAWNDPDLLQVLTAVCKVRCDASTEFVSR
jgi:hypothetical protein